MSHRNTIESLESRRLLSAKISISANGSGIGAGDTSPSRADFTDFGPVAVSGTASAVTRSFTVKNTGTTTIKFSGHRQSVSGADASDFTITKGLPSSLAKGKSATFTVKFDAGDAATQHGAITVSSNASTKNYVFNIQGEGLNTSAIGSSGLQVAVTHKGSGTAAVKGQVLEMNYTGYLLDGTKFDSSLNTGRTPFQFTSEIGNVIKGWQQGLAGTKVGDKRTLFIPASLAYGSGGQGSIPANATLIFETETLRVGGPSLKATTTVKKKTKSIVSGDTSPSTTDGTDFGTVTKGSSVARKFTMTLDLADTSFFQNGYSGITFTDANLPVKVTGANASDFTITPTTNTQGQSTYVTFVVTFKPSGTGKRSAQIEIGYTGTVADPASGSQTPVYTHSDTLKFAIQGTGA